MKLIKKLNFDYNAVKQRQIVGTIEMKDQAEKTVQKKREEQKGLKENRKPKRQQTESSTNLLMSSRLKN